MVKELYDPHMFNYMWESLDQDRFVVGTYYIEDTKRRDEFIDHLARSSGWRWKARRPAGWT